MAVKETNTPGATPQADFTVNPAGAASANFGTAPDASVAAPGLGGGYGLWGLMETFGNSSAVLGAEGEKFLEDLKKGLNEARFPITFGKLAEPTGAHFVMANNVAIPLIFADILPPLRNPLVPKSEYIRQASESISRQYTGVKLLNAILVFKADYARVGKWIQHLIDQLIMAVRPELISIPVGDLTAQTEYVIDSSIELCQQFTEAMNPSAVQPRIDVGLTVLVRKPRPISRNYGQQQSQLDEATPIMAIGGYTEFVRTTLPQTGEVKHVGFFRITSITSRFPLPIMVPLALTFAADEIVLRGGWRRQFNYYVKGKPNIGNLVADNQDPNGRPWHAPDPGARDLFINQHVIQPSISIDVVDGVPRPLGVSHLVRAEGTARLIEDVSKFFGQPIPQSPTPLTHVSNIDYIGYYGQPGMLRDSRHLDYLNILAEVGAVGPDVQQVMLQYSGDPLRRATVVSNLANGTFQSLFSCSTVTISSQFLAFLSTQINATMKIVHQGEGAAAMPIDFALQQSLGFGNFQPVAGFQARPMYGQGISYF